MNFTVIIPARYGSSRLPGKPLLDIAGKPMIQRVYEQAAQSDADEVIVATDDQRIADVVVKFGGSVCMTSAEHVSGTDRIQEVVSSRGYEDHHIVVNVQGDEPLIPPAVINQVAQNLEEQSVPVATLAEPIHQLDEFNDPNLVKVVVGQDNCALYFSRAPIPWPRDQSDGGNELFALKHPGIYAYRVAFLNQFVAWPPAPLELIEKLEQLRALWHGVRIHTAQSCAPIPPGIDTQKDLQRVVHLLTT